MEKVERKIPVIFQKLYSVVDSRFTKVKIWLMHLEENYNGSYFSKDSVTKAIPSLANTPILGYIEEKSDGESDFSDHRMILVRNEDGVEIKYIGQAYGMIPETNNAKFEKRVGDDGVEREYLTVEGVLWNKWGDPVEIMNRDNEKAQSMELANEFTGSWNKKTGLFHFEDFKFFGACILGDGVSPAMNRASIEVEQEFSLKDFESTVQTQMEEFKIAYSRYQESQKDLDINFNKEGENMNEKLIELLSKYSLTEEAIKEKGFKLEDYSTEEELEAGIQEYTKTTEFALSSSQLVEEIRMQLSTKTKNSSDGSYTYQEYWYVDSMPDQNTIVAYNTDNWSLVGFSYSVEGDKITVDFESSKRFKISYVPMDIANDSNDQANFSLVSKEYFESQKAKFASENEAVVAELNSIKETFANTEQERDELKSKFSVLETELQKLQEFKANKQVEERQSQESELFEQFSSQLTDEEMAPVKEVASQMSIEELEVKLFALVGKKTAKFSKSSKDSNSNVKIPLVVDEPKKVVSPYDDILEKHFANKANV